MNSYLKQIKGVALKLTNILAIMGNESVDLDSAVSSISLAYHLNKFGSSSRLVPQEKRNKTYSILPVLNCKRDELPLKTEVTYWLKKNDIDLENLLCRDEIDLVKNVENFILVDHHVSPFNRKVISVIDHRPYDEKSHLNEECIVNLHEVGSCATLIIEAIKNDYGIEKLKELTEIVHLLYAPIILDTVNFNKNANKARELDFKMAEMIETLLNIENSSAVRNNIFKELVDARANISELDSLQVLSKDLKIISNEKSSVRVAFPGVHVFEYVKMDNALDNIKLFSNRENIDVIVLMGMRPVEQSGVERQIGVINIKNKKLYDDILDLIQTMNNPALNLISESSIQFLDGEFFIQGNVQASRKQILPAIKKLLEAW